MIKFKFILIGEGTVGKTSLISQFINNQFIDDYIMTVGTDKSIKEIDINHKKITLEIWDTPGQADYNIVNKIFMKNTDIALIVYDITNRKTFDKIGHWIKLVKEINENRNLIIGITANKSDLYENAEVTNDEAKEYMNTIKDVTDLYFESSASDHENVEIVFNELTKVYIDKYGLKEKKIDEKETTTIKNNSTNNGNNTQMNFEMIQTNYNNNSNEEEEANDIYYVIEKDDKCCSSKCIII